MCIQRALQGQGQGQGQGSGGARQLQHYTSDVTAPRLAARPRQTALHCVFIAQHPRGLPYRRLATTATSKSESELQTRPLRVDRCLGGQLARCHGGSERERSYQCSFTTVYRCRPAASSATGAERRATTIPMVRRRMALVAVVLALAGGARAQLKEGFYDYACPQAEKIVKDYVMAHIPHAPSVAATLLRTHFHDCFVRGCDASVLLNATGGNEAEKDAAPNLTLRGFAFVDRIKALLEKECPGVVSCADIVALAARDSVGVIGGPFWSVPTGRRDGTVSIKQEALDQIPAPTMNFTTLLQSFQNKSLGLADLVWLSGAHTIGIAHCNSFSERLYNFTGRGGPEDADPSLDPLYAANLRRTKCKTPTDNTTIVEMDPGSFLTFDLSYYRGVLKRRGLFQSDAALITDATSKADILSVVNAPPEVFFQVFARSMVRLGAVDVKTGSEGEIRKHCAVVNKY